MREFNYTALTDKLWDTEIVIYAHSIHEHKRDCFLITNKHLHFQEPMV